jgi:hypothetical protein
MINQLKIKDSRLFNSLNENSFEYIEIKKSKILYQILLAITLIALSISTIYSVMNLSGNYITNVFTFIFLLLISLRLNWLIKNLKTEIIISHESIKLPNSNEDILWNKVNYISILRIEKSEESECLLRIITSNNIHNIDIKYMNYNSDEIETILSFYSNSAKIDSKN